MSASTKSENATTSPVTKPKKDPTMKYIVDWNGKFRVIKKVGKTQDYFGTMDTVDQAKERRDAVVLMADQGFNASQIKAQFSIGSDYSKPVYNMPKGEGRFDLTKFMELYEFTKGSDSFTKEHKELINNVMIKKIEADKLAKEIEETPSSIIAVMEEIRRSDEHDTMKAKIAKLEKENKTLKKKPIKAVA